MSALIPRRSQRCVASGLVCVALTLVAAAGCHRSAAPAPPTVVASRQFPGVHLVDTRKGGFYVQILSGMVGAGDPLYIIDGTPMQVDQSRGIDWVKPEDVVSIKVLKDPADTTVYGAQGRNGVILISTRLGMQRIRVPR